MIIRSKHQNSVLNPPLMAVVVATIGMTGILFDDFGPSNVLHNRAAARMITAAAVSRAGAIETPSGLSINSPTFPPV